MNGSYSFDTRITVLTETEIDTPGGVIKTWVKGNTLWASILQKVLNMFIATQIDYSQRYAQSPIYRIIVRSKQTWKFESTRFLWTSPSEGVRTLEPFELKRLPGTRHTSYTSLLVRDITDLKEGLA